MRSGVFTVSAIRNPQIAKEKKSLMDEKKSADIHPHPSFKEWHSRPASRRDPIVGPLRQLRTHSVQGTVRIHESELSHSVISVARLTETTLDAATGPLRSDGISI